MKYKEIDMTKIEKIPFGDLLVFVDLPTIKDLEEAEKNDGIVICRLQGKGNERLDKVEKLRKELGDSFIYNRLFMDARFADEDVLSQEDYQIIIKNHFNQDMDKPLWFVPAGYDKGKIDLGKEER